MIGGQVMDIEGEHHKPTAQLVERIHRAKTGALITTSIVTGGLLGLGTKSGAPGLDSETWVSTNLSHTDILARLRTFGENAGLAFQIVDDILDMTQTSAELGKTAGKDTALRQSHLARRLRHRAIQTRRHRPYLRRLRRPRPLRPIRHPPEIPGPISSRPHPLTKPSGI